MSRPPPLGPTPNCVRNRLVLWVLKRAQHTWTLQLSDSFFAFRLVFLQVKAATRSTPCGLMRLLDDCFIFTEMISNQFEFGTLSRDLQSFIRPKWCIFSSIKCMLGRPLKGLGYLFRFQPQPQPHRKRWKRWQKIHNMGLRWLPLEAGKIAGHSGTSLVLGMGQKLWQNSLGCLGDHSSW